MRIPVLLCAILMVGCGSESVTPNPDPVAVSATVTASGKPVTDVKFNFQPTGAGLPAVVEVAEGKFEAQITPGKYTWFISPGKAEASFASVPPQFHEGALERQFEVKGAESIEFKLD